MPPHSLARYLQQEQDSGRLTHSLQQLILQIAQACIRIANAINDGALIDILGDAGSHNVLGESQKKLDLLSQRMLIEEISWGGHVAAFASEEMVNAHVVSESKGEALLIFDPLDGSSNIDVNLSIGTIFSVLPKPADCIVPNDADFLQPGRNQLAAGYVIYGPSTLLVLTIGHGTHVFTLARGEGCFFLTHPDRRIPPKTQEFAVNMSNQRHWKPAMRRYIADLVLGEQGPRAMNFNMRWTASMVAEVHRILMRGGFFSYPWDARHPERPGHLRLMYEANPMAWIIEQAGGMATDGHTALLAIQPTSIHQRTPVFLGSKHEVETAARYHAETER